MNYEKKNTKINSILFISEIYPSMFRQYSGAFVREYIRAIAGMGVKCTVISPVSIFDLKAGGLPPKISFDSAIKSTYIKIIRPRYISFSNKRIFSFDTKIFTKRNYNNAIFHSLHYLNFYPDVVCGHFLYFAGEAVAQISSKLKIPSFVMVGESGISSNIMSLRKIAQNLKNIDGFISVSSMNKNYLQSELRIQEKKITVLPNGVDLNLFYPRSKIKMRRKYKFPLDKIIIVFVGHFNYRKGPQRVIDAVKDLDNIGIVLVGSGNIPLSEEKILYKGVLKHSSIPEILSTGDIFVLPTLAEGSCNAIIEALACGLPVITSKDKFNDEIINDSVAIRIDPLNIKQLRSAIVKLMNNKHLRNKMSTEAIVWAKKFDINLRAKKIIEWMEHSVN